MHRLTRKQVYLAPLQAKRVKARAKQEGVAEAEVIRRALDLGLEQLEGELSEAQRRARQAITGVLEARAAGGNKAGERVWSRDEIYEERLRR